MAVFTNYDLSSINTKGQFCTMIKTCSSIPREQALRDVESWMQGKQL